MKKEEARTVCLYDLDHTLARPLLEQCEYPWEALPRIRDLILELGNPVCRKANMKNAVRLSGSIKRPGFLKVPIWEKISSSGKMRRCATVPSCGAMPWWVRALWWETPQNLKT